MDGGTTAASNVGARGAAAEQVVLPLSTAIFGPPIDDQGPLGSAGVLSISWYSASDGRPILRY